MRIGIVADIHEAVELLEVALGRLAHAGIDRLVVLGDLFETGPRIDEVVRRLEAAGAVGVFGNHDYGLCCDPSDYVRARFSAPTLAYMGSLRPRMELAGCLFAHREPWLDGSDVEQIWHVDEEDLPASTIERSFAAVPDRTIFIGHYHCWRAFTLAGPMPWDGGEPLALAEDSPTLVVIHAVCDGHAAIFETDRRILTPIDLYEGRTRPDGRPLPRLLTD
jgi:hypothetical protein